MLPAGGPAGSYPPFWKTKPTNNLYGVQVGVDGKMLELGRLSLDGLMKIGLFDNNAGQSTGVSLKKTVYPATATTNRAAFASEAGVQVKYQISDSLALKAGYEALWLDGVALAPGQIQETLTTGEGARAWRQLQVERAVPRRDVRTGVFVLGRWRNPPRPPSQGECGAFVRQGECGAFVRGRASRGRLVTATSGIRRRVTGA